MALPSSVESAMRNVRRAAEALSNTRRELEAAGRSGDADRTSRAESSYKSAAGALEVAAKSLAEAARKT
jgi:hypothetical protein